MKGDEVMFNKFCKGFYMCCKKSGDKIDDFLENNSERIRNFCIGFYLILLAAVFLWIFFATVGLKFSLIFLSIIVGIVIICLIYEKGKKVANEENKENKKSR